MEAYGNSQVFHLRDVICLLLMQALPVKIHLNVKVYVCLRKKLIPFLLQERSYLVRVMPGNSLEGVRLTLSMGNLYFCALTSLTLSILLRQDECVIICYHDDQFC